MRVNHATGNACMRCDVSCVLVGEWRDAMRWSGERNKTLPFNNIFSLMHHLPSSDVFNTGYQSSTLATHRSAHDNDVR